MRASYCILLLMSLLIAPVDTRAETCAGCVPSSSDYQETISFCVSRTMSLIMTGGLCTWDGQACSGDPCSVTWFAFIEEISAGCASGMSFNLKVTNGEVVEHDDPFLIGVANKESGGPVNVTCGDWFKLQMTGDESATLKELCTLCD